MTKKQAPFTVSTRLRYIGKRQSWVGAERTPHMFYGLETEIVRINEPFGKLNGSSVWVIQTANGPHGTCIYPEDSKDWEIIEDRNHD